MSTEPKNESLPDNETPTEQALRVSELSYRRLFEAAQDGILILDVDAGRITDANPFLTTLLGYSREEMLGKTVGELSPFKDVVSNQAMLERLQKDGYVRYEDLPLKTKDGRQIAVEFVSNVYQAGDKKVIQCNIRDITRRKHAEATASLLAAIVESSDDAIYAKDLNGLITSWNQGAEKIFGYTASEMIGTSILRLIPADRQDEEHQIIKRIKLGESVMHMETLRQTKDGRIIDVSVTASPIKDAGGKITGVSKVLRDISERKLAEAALQQSEKKFRDLIENLQIGVVAHDPDTAIQFSNPMAAQLLGLTPDQMLGKTAVDLAWRFVREDGSRLALDEYPVNRARLATLAQIPNIILGICRPDRENPTWVQCNTHPIRDWNGQLQQIVVTFFDITARKLAETASMESQRFLRSTLDALSSHISILDEQGVIIEVNAAWNRFARENHLVGNYGVGDSYLRVCDSVSGHFSEEASAVAGGIRAVIAGQRDEFELEYPCHSPQAKRWFVLRVTRFGGDGLVRVVVAHENITARKLAEQEVLWKTALLEAQLESSIDGILVVGNRGEQILQNRRIAELWKIPPLIIAAKDEAAQFAFVTSQTKTPRQFADRVSHLYAHPDETSQDEVELIDGTILDRYSAPVRDKTGKCYGRIWSFRDITERRKLERNYFQAQKMESIGQLAGGIAHDFNNILSAIVGNLYLAKISAAAHPAILENLENISAASQRAADLVKQILTFSRQTKPERAPLKLNHVVLEVLKLLRASLPASIRIQTELAETPAVLANATAIHQVIMNLGTNAWHAMREQNGVLKVELNVLEVDEDFARTRPDLHPGSYVQLSVSDTGCGMDRHTLEHVFEPFFTTKGVGEGTGLGLAVVHGIMKSHDGGISVYSQPGKGTRFNLYFPVIAAEVTAREIKAAPIPRGHGEHILFVDDEEPLINAGKKMLEHLGYVVTAKTSPLEAITLVRDQPEAFDLVITDLTMPGLDGVALGRRLLEIQPRLAIILTTGYSGRMTAEKVRELGFRELLSKPCTARVLAETIQRVLHPAAATEK